MICKRRLSQIGLLLGALGMLAVSGCRMGPGDDGAQVRLINAVPGENGLTVSVEGRRVWKRSLFRSSTGYESVAAGTYPVQVDSTDLGRVLVQKPVTLEKRQNYTLLTLAASNGEPPQALVLEDTVSEKLPDDKTRLRLVNAALGAPPVDLVVNTIVGVKSVAYGKRSAPLTLAGGHYDLQLAAADSPDVLVGPVSLDLQAGHAYTLVAMGHAADHSLSLEVYPDK